MRGEGKKCDDRVEQTRAERGRVERNGLHLVHGTRRADRERGRRGHRFWRGERDGGRREPTGWRGEREKAREFTFADAQEGELAERDDGAARRELSVEIRIADR